MKLAQKKKPAKLEASSAAAASRRRVRMTRELAEKSAVGGATGPKFDGAAFLRTLKK